MPKDLGGRNHVDHRSLPWPCRPLAMELLAGVADRVVRASGDTAEWARHPAHGIHALHADIRRRPVRRAHRPLGDAGGDCAPARDGRAPDPQRPRRRRARGPARGAGPDDRPRRPRRDLRRARRQPRCHRRQPGRRDLRLFRDRRRLCAAVPPDGGRASRIVPPPGRRGPRHADALFQHHNRDHRRLRRHHACDLDRADLRRARSGARHALSRHPDRSHRRAARDPECDDRTRCRANARRRGRGSDRAMPVYGDSRRMERWNVGLYATETSDCLIAAAPARAADCGPSRQPSIARISARAQTA